MKKVLSLLVAFVFLQVQSWALSGGPDYSQLNGGGSNNPSIIGTYGGVLIPKSTTGTTTTGPQPAAIGVFSLAVPETGLASGAAIVFVQGTAFIGQIAGIGDADKQTIQGLIGATSNFQVQENIITFTTTTTGGTTTTTENITTQSFPVFAQGSFKANVIEGDAGAFSTAPNGSGNGTTGGGGGNTSSSSTTSSAAEIGSTNSARLTGKAEIGTFFQFSDVTGSPTINSITQYSIDGIKQNNVPNAVTGLSFNFGSGSSGS